jgi:hypothetical protein
MRLSPTKPSLPRAPFSRAALLSGIISVLCLLLPAAVGLWIKGHSAASPDGPSGNMFQVMLLLVGLAVPLGLGAILLHFRARRCFRNPATPCRAPGRLGLVLGTTALLIFLAGLVALVLNASASGRARARDRAARMNLTTGLAELAEVSRNREPEPVATHRLALEAVLNSQSLKNPWNHRSPAMRVMIQTAGTGPEESEALARKEATELGEVVFVLSVPPGDGQPRYLAGAVLTRGLDPPTPGSRPSGIPTHLTDPGLISAVVPLAAHLDGSKTNQMEIPTSGYR